MTRWEIHARLIIEAESEERAEKALDAIERAAKRSGVPVTIHVHASEGIADD